MTSIESLKLLFFFFAEELMVKIRRDHGSVINYSKFSKRPWAKNQIVCVPHF